MLRPTTRCTPIESVSIPEPAYVRLKIALERPAPRFILLLEYEVLSGGEAKLAAPIEEASERERVLIVALRSIGGKATLSSH